MFLRWIPKAAYGIVHEATRHILKRPVVGIVAVARTKDGKILLIRRGDTGTWVDHTDLRHVVGVGWKF